MRRALTFQCHEATLVGALDGGLHETGLLIVSGGNEVLSGPHRGMAMLAGDIAARGHPVFRFDRRGIGDSEGENGGFKRSKTDIESALASFRAHCPALRQVVAFGNCDAATALVLHEIEVDSRVLANPWIVEPVDDLPPPSAIRDRYGRRLRDPKAWTALLTGKIDLRALAKGLGRVGASEDDTLASQFAQRIGRCPTTILLSERDNTAIAFRAGWDRVASDDARATTRIVTLDSASHSFASEADDAILKQVLVDALGRASPG